MDPLQWHLTPEYRVSRSTTCRCPSRPPGPVERLRQRLDQALAGPHLLLLVAAVALLLLVHG